MCILWSIKSIFLQINLCLADTISTVKNLSFVGIYQFLFYIYGYLQCSISKLTLWTIAKLFLSCYFKMSPTCVYLSALEPWQTLLSTFRKPYSVLLGTQQSRRDDYANTGNGFCLQSNQRLSLRLRVFQANTIILISLHMLLGMTHTK